MSSEQMADQIVSFVRENPGASFPELMRHIGPDAEGDMSMYFDGNVKVWEGMSPMFAAALRLAQRDIEPRPADVMAYLIDGAVLRLPLAKSLPPKGGFKKPRWLPITYHLKDTAKKVGRSTLLKGDRPVSSR